MKLNNKRTVLVGLAFLSICAFWQMYDNVIPLILRETFHMNESLAGAVMALDKRYRVPVLLYYYEGYSTPEIAELLGVPLNTVTTRLSRARAKLKNFLTEDD